MATQRVTVNLPQPLYEQIILLRAQAAKLLKERGQDISELWVEA
ncbi:MAG: hypothetical protein WCS37_12350 [Chloroflexota bacterium]